MEPREAPPGDRRRAALEVDDVDGVEADDRDEEAHVRLRERLRGGAAERARGLRPPSSRGPDVARLLPHRPTDVAALPEPRLAAVQGREELRDRVRVRRLRLRKAGPVTQGRAESRG